MPTVIDELVLKLGIDRSQFWSMTPGLPKTIYARSKRRHSDRVLKSRRPARVALSSCERIATCVGAGASNAHFMPVTRLCNATCSH